MFTHFNVTCLLQNHQFIIPKVYMEAKNTETAKVFPFTDNKTFRLRRCSILREIQPNSNLHRIRAQRLLQFQELRYVESFITLLINLLPLTF
jgi:hypothetical protein